MKTYFASLMLLFVVAVDARAVNIDWLPVGNPGNAGDTVDGDPFAPGIQSFGAVPYSYSIGKYDVTVSQYAEFLNTKDPTGANLLGLYIGQRWYSPSNGTSGIYIGIDFDPDKAAGTKYSEIAGCQYHPVTHVTWFSAIRFANWLHNGQGDGDTETGAYTLLGGTPTPSDADSITRNAGATVFLPTENEWYKAAYYDPATNSYFQYPTSSNEPPIASHPTALPNHANFNDAVRKLTDVGAYNGTTSPYGAFDMGGNVYQWNETLISGFDMAGNVHVARGLRGGTWAAKSKDLLSSPRVFAFPTNGNPAFGFRVASIR